jgi:oligoribonuclease NrnB/cAMP/cGMP phosphodiesterase (DHH superfamily)
VKSGKSGNKRKGDNTVATKEVLFKKLLKPKKNSKVLLLTHTDMDAAGAEIAVRAAFNNVDVKHCSNSTMSEDICINIITDEIASKYDLIFVCDISIGEADTAYINAINLSENHNKVVLLDHHISATHLNKQDWAVVEPMIVTDSLTVSEFIQNIDKEKLMNEPGYNEEVWRNLMNDRDKLDELLYKTGAHSSGTSLMFDYLEYNGMYDGKHINKQFLIEIVHMIQAYDTWDWFYIYGQNEKYRTIDTLCDIYGLGRFVKNFMKRVKGHEPAVIFNETDKLLLDIEQDKIDRYKEMILRKIVTCDVQLIGKGKKYSMAYCYTGERLSETFEVMKEKFPEIDIYAINFGEGVSFRTSKEDINLGMLCKAYGGGGHQGAAGFRVSDEQMQKQMEEILRGIIYNVEKHSNK